MKQLLKDLKSIKFNPKKIFKKSPSVSSKSEPPSFSSTSSASSSSSSSSSGESSGPPPVRTRSEEIITDWTAVDESTPPPLRFDDFVQAFKSIDRDGDGKITRVELESVLRRVAGITAADEIDAMIGEIDRDGDGCVSTEELEAFAMVLETTSPEVAGEEELREAFDCFDADHDGKITAEELKAVFESLGDERCTLEDCRRMIESVDKNGDGFVCFQDFTVMMDLRR